MDTIKAIGFVKGGAGIHLRERIGGYWTGKPTTIEQVAAAMGNSRQVCWEHYAKWCDNYTDPIWDAVDGGH